jgi:plastocyanin
MARLGIAVVLAAALSACAAPSALPTTPPASPTPTLATPSPAPPVATAAATPRPAAAAVTIEMGDHFFEPSQVTVAVGTTVTWKVVGQATHDIKARDGSFVAITLVAGDTFSHTFTRPGRYEYVCAQHEGDGMVGVVTVE